MAPAKISKSKARGNSTRSTKPESNVSSKSKSGTKSTAARKVAKLTAKDKARRNGRHGRRTHRDVSESELSIPKLNMVTPAGVQKPQGKKKGKVFVDDKESMMTILALVNAEKEGQIESKMMKERQLEEIRQARQREMEARAAEKKSKFEATKKEIRNKKKRTGQKHEEKELSPAATAPPKHSKKRVSFG